MVAVLKSLQSMLTGILTDLPDGVKMVTEFLWKVRWFLLIGWLGWMVFQAVTQVLPYLMAVLVVKSLLGPIASLFF
jgi:hypothetical protein